MKTKSLFAVLVLCVAMISCSTVEARGGRGHRDGGWLKKLDLSKEQKDKIHAIKKEGREKMKAAHQKAQEQRKVLKEKLRGDASSDELRSLFKNMKSQHEEMALARFERLLKIRDILTPEQRKEIEFGWKHKRKWREKRSRRYEDNEG